MKTVWTSGEIAKRFRVSQHTVIRWIDRGLLDGFRIPGSTHRRVTGEALRRFTLANDLPAELLAEA